MIPTKTLNKRNGRLCRPHCIGILRLIHRLCQNPLPIVVHLLEKCVVRSRSFSCSSHRARASRVSSALMFVACPCHLACWSIWYLRWCCFTPFHPTQGCHVVRDSCIGNGGLLYNNNNRIATVPKLWGMRYVSPGCGESTRSVA